MEESVETLKKINSILIKGLSDIIKHVGIIKGKNMPIITVIEVIAERALEKAQKVLDDS